MLQSAITSILILLLVCTSTFAQQYHPFIEARKIWTIEHIRWEGIGGDMTISHESIELLGDTSINDTIYHLFGSRSHPKLLREDTINHKLYRRFRSLNQECLVFDFSAEEGDTVQTCGGIEIIESDTVIILNNGASRKAWITMTFDYIEGIGSTFGFIETFDWTDVDYESTLLCVEKDDIDLYGNRCNQVGTNTTGSQSQLDLFPNPVEEVLQIQGTHELHDARIFDLSGKTVFSTTGSVESINIRHLPSGLYYLECIGSSVTFRQPFIKH